MKLKIIDRQYGCFQVRSECDKCGKVNRVYEFSYSNDGFSMSDKEKIIRIVHTRMKQGEHFHCMKCGKNLFEEDDVNE